MIVAFPLNPIDLESLLSYSRPFASKAFINGLSIEKILLIEHSTIILERAYSIASQLISEPIILLKSAAPNARPTTFLPDAILSKFPISPIFIPANKLDYIDKALNSGADGIIFDLEDSILQEDKRSARDNLYSFLANNSLNTISYIRINDLNTETGITDLDTFRDLSYEIIIPKFETDKDFIKIPGTLSIIPLIETPLAIRNLDKIASGKNVVWKSYV